MTFDADGNVLSVTVHEPRFTATDKALLLASRRDERARGSHGLPLSETTDPSLQNEWEVPLPTTDFAQAKLNAAKESYQKRKDAGEILPDLDSLLWRVERRG